METIMNRIVGSLFASLLTVAFGWPVATMAQGTKPMPRVAYVWLFGVGPSAPFADDFTGELAKLGWVDGKTVKLELRDAKGDPEKLNTILRDLADSKVDIIAVACTPEAVAAKKVTTTIPIVVAATGDPVKSGLVASMARPGGNITGVSASVLELSAKRVQILKEVSPGLTRATALWNPVRGDNAVEVAAMQDAARTLGIQLASQQVRGRDEIEVALDVMARERTQGLTESGDPFMYTYAPELVAFAAKARIPAVYDNRYFVDAGGLMSYGPNLPTLHRRAAHFVDRILKGARPADLPFEQPDKFELVINLKAAQAIGLTVPQSLISRADQVIR
jgi:putative ABC transport system substrate-binding protein